MTAKILFFVVGIAVLALPLFWLLIFRYIIKHSKELQPVSAENMSRKQLRKQQLSTEILLTSDERRAIKNRMWKMGSVVGAVLLLVIGFTTWNYWRFAIDGESLQATITNVSVHRSGGKHRRTTYTYTLKANVDGVLITDSYSAGSASGYVVGSIVDAYAATSETKTELAIANVVDKSLPSAGIIVSIIAIAVGSILYSQHKNLKSGKARISNLPARFRTARIANMPIVEASTIPSASFVQTPMSPDGLPMYTIGGDDFPKS